MVQKLPKETQFFTFIHPTALIMGDVEIGEGSFIGAYSILTTNIKIGNHAILNRNNHIGHDCVIGDYFSAMPGSIVSGNVTIHDCVYLGTNSSIKEKLSIHSLTTIGLNSGVVHNIEESGTYGGTPTKKI
jgi:sugar O-acyltransferase (sialic acid O-acetyltransferase NeuD family)